MLLARVAESMYWMGRYVERAECTARILIEHCNLHEITVRVQAHTIKKSPCVKADGMTSVDRSKLLA